MVALSHTRVNHNDLQTLRQGEGTPTSEYRCTRAAGQVLVRNRPARAIAVSALFCGVRASSTRHPARLPTPRIQRWPCLSKIAAAAGTQHVRTGSSGGGNTGWGLILKKVFRARDREIPSPNLTRGTDLKSVSGARRRPNCSRGIAQQQTAGQLL